MSILVETFEDSPEEWDRALSHCDGATFCHMHGWRNVLDSLGHETYWMSARATDGEVEGLLPLARVRSRLFGDYLVSMPFLNYGGPVGSAAARSALASWATEEARRQGVDLLELRNLTPQLPEGLDESFRKLTVVKPLPETSEELWDKGIKSKVRSQIRRPMKEGMEVEFGPELVGDFYRVFSTTMRDLGTPVLPRAFFDVLRTSFPLNAVFAVVRLGGEPIAAACGLTWAEEFEITWAGSSREHQRSAPNMLLYWGLMEESIRRGMKVFNFGRCSPDSSTHRFKKQWGSTDVPLPWLQWSPQGVPSTPDPSSPKFRAATAVWAKLPVPVANAIGPRLSRLIP